MPTFDFRCTKCANVFEFNRPFGSAVTPACPACKSKKTEKLMSPPAIQFKGSGWYKTDSRKASTTGPKKEDVKPEEKKKEIPGEKKSPDAQDKKKT